MKKETTLSVLKEIRDLLRILVIKNVPGAVIPGLAVEVSKTPKDTFTVDYSKSISELIKQGNYYYANSDINDSNFPQTENGIKDLKFKLFHFDRYISSEDVIKEIKKEGFRPATAQEILAYGITYPEQQKEFPIVALDSVWGVHSGYRLVVCLDCGGDGRRADLDYDFAAGWDDGYRFLAVASA